MNIIGLGKAGCSIAEEFKQHPQYTVFKFDSDEKLKRRKNCFFIPKQSSVELYDSNPINLDRLKKGLDEDDEVFFIICGSGKVSGCALWILKEVSHLKVNIVYIKPETNTLDKSSKLRHRAHFHILQEYTRSGLFEKFFVIDNNVMPDVVGKTSILNYYNKINSFVVSIVHWYNIYRNTDPVFDTFKDGYKTSRLSAFSYIDVENEQEQKTFELEKTNQIKYFYGINRLTIENDESLLDKLNRIATKEASEQISVSYGIFTTEMEIGFSFAVHSSSDIQEEQK